MGRLFQGRFKAILVERDAFLLELAHYVVLNEKEAPDRNATIVRVHASGTYSYLQIAQHFGIHFTTVGRIVRGSK